MPGITNNADYWFKLFVCYIAGQMVHSLKDSDIYKDLKTAALGVHGVELCMSYWADTEVHSLVSNVIHRLNSKPITCVSVYTADRCPGNPTGPKAVRSQMSPLTNLQCSTALAHSPTS